MTLADSDGSSLPKRQLYLKHRTFKEDCGIIERSCHVLDTAGWVKTLTTTTAEQPELHEMITIEK